jgi:hypothetical protein
MSNFEKIERGMTRAEVHQLLGPPTAFPKSHDRHITAEQWKEKDLEITVNFRNDRVVNSHSYEK